MDHVSCGSWQIPMLAALLRNRLWPVYLAALLFHSSLCSHGCHIFCISWFNIILILSNWSWFAKYERYWRQGSKKCLMPHDVVHVLCLFFLVVNFKPGIPHWDVKALFQVVPVSCCQFWSRRQQEANSLIFHLCFSCSGYITRRDHAASARGWHLGVGDRNYLQQLCHLLGFRLRHGFWFQSRVWAHWAGPGHWTTHGAR